MNATRSRPSAIGHRRSVSQADSRQPTADSRQPIADSRQPWGCLLLTGLLVLSGCGGPVLPPLVPVEGKVTVDGQDLTSGQVVLVFKEATPNAPPSVGQIESGGTYKVATGGKNGAPLGKYKILVNPPMLPPASGTGPPKIPFHKKYSKLETTPLAFEVVANPQPGAYDLKLTK